MEFVAGIIVCLGMLWLLLESTKLVEEKKERQRKGLTDYYDNPIRRDSLRSNKERD